MYFVKGGVSLDKNMLPNITLKNHNGENVNLRDFIDQKVVLYLYALNANPYCTYQNIAFKNLYRLFEDCDCEVIGVAEESVESQKEFVEKNNLPFVILSDSNRELLKHFNLPRYARSTFVFNEDGILEKEWNYVDPENHVEDVISFVKTI